MLPVCCREGKKTQKSVNAHDTKQRRTSFKRVTFLLNLVDLGLDEEELDERGRAVYGRVDVLQREAGLVYEVKVLSEEVLHPQQGGRRLLLPIICTHFTTVVQFSLYASDSDIKIKQRITERYKGKRRQNSLFLLNIRKLFKQVS